MIDTHCHLNFEDFNDCREDVINESIEAGVDRFLVPAIDTNTCQEVITLAEKYPKNIFAAVGIHPNYSKEANLVEFQKILGKGSPQIKAIGEIGLDFYRSYSPPEAQNNVFIKMLELAKIYSLPICLHNRDADTELLNILGKWHAENNACFGGVFHAFNGSQEVMEWGIEHEYYFGVGGPVTYKKSETLRQTIKVIGLSRIVLETDSPYLSPVPFRGKMNTPMNLHLVAKCISEILEINVNEVVKITDHNAQNLFGIK